MKFVAVVTRKASSRQKHFSRICLRRAERAKQLYMEGSFREIYSRSDGRGSNPRHRSYRPIGGRGRSAPIAPADPVGHRRH